MNHNELQIESISDLIKIVSAQISKHNKVLWFRGHFESKWILSPSIFRNYDNGNERNFVHRFRTRALSRKEILPGYNERSKWLSLMQHYELPTRLLDWTRSPLIALYFALDKYIYEEKISPVDACIWMLEPHALNSNEGLGIYTPSIESEFCNKLIDPAFDSEVPECNKIMAVMAGEIDMRMFVQQGCFTIHSRKNPMNETKECKEYLTKIIIPSKFVQVFAKQIDSCGFRKGDLFPDLVNLSNELKGIYKPRLVQHRY